MIEKSDALDAIPAYRICDRHRACCCQRSHQAVYTDDLLNLAASLEAKNGSPSGKRLLVQPVQPLAVGSITLNVMLNSMPSSYPLS